jgi:disulfide bond formation protein DsbB
MFSALLATLAALGALVVFIAVFLGARGDVLLAGIREVAHWLAFSVAAAAMIGSLYFSEVAEFVPCKLCWYQRIAMYSLAVILLVAAVKRDHGVTKYALPLAVIGAGISTYHYLLEWFPSIETDVCSIDVPCTTIWFREFGFATLSFMALSGFLLIIALMVALQTRKEQSHEQSEL